MNGVLNKPTLVLNRSWMPVHVTTVHRALVMLWSETAQAVCPESYRLHTWEDWIGLEPAPGTPAIRTGRLRFPAPEVVYLDHYNRQPRNTVSFTRSNLMKR